MGEVNIARVAVCTYDLEKETAVIPGAWEIGGDGRFQDAVDPELYALFE
ncbi:hypothetical protein ES705_19050 [subsurface metagenome]